MLDYLIATLAPDGQMPLLKDTTWDNEADPNDLLSAGALYFNEPSLKKNDDFRLYPLLLFGVNAWERFKRWPVGDSPRTSAALRESGHFIMRDEEKAEYLIFDAGKPCPDNLPAHAHADMLSYELMVGARRVVVDSGVYEYAAGPWRDYFRSTRAHNTVEIAAENQSEVWDSFRVARRARPGRVVWEDLGPGCFLIARKHQVPNFRSDNCTDGCWNPSGKASVEQDDFIKLDIPAIAD